MEKYLDVLKSSIKMSKSEKSLRKKITPVGKNRVSLEWWNVEFMELENVPISNSIGTKVSEQHRHSAINTLIIGDNTALWVINMSRKVSVTVQQFQQHNSQAPIGEWRGQNRSCRNVFKDDPHPFKFYFIKNKVWKWIWYNVNNF